GGGERLAEVKDGVRSSPSPTGVFPFRLGRQAIQMSCSLFFLQLGKPPAELHCLVPGDLFDREPFRVQFLDALLAAARDAEVAGVVARDALILLLRDRMD